MRAAQRIFGELTKGTNDVKLVTGDELEPHTPSKPRGSKARVAPSTNTNAYVSKPDISVRPKSTKSKKRGRQERAESEGDGIKATVDKPTKTEAIDDDFAGGEEGA